jgi:hypothetical protein
MFVLNIEHTITNFDGWKSAFDSHPHDRNQTGAQRYRILRPTDNPNAVIVEVEFATMREAEAVLMAMRETWSRMQGTLLAGSSKGCIAEVVEGVDL